MGLSFLKSLFKREKSVPQETVVKTVSFDSDGRPIIGETRSILYDCVRAESTSGQYVPKPLPGEMAVIDEGLLKVLENNWPSSEHQIESLREKHKLDVSPNISSEAASFLIFSSEYIKATYHRVNQSHERVIPAHVRRKTIEFVLADPKLRKHIKTLNTRRFNNSDVQEYLPLSSKYYQQIEIFVKNIK